MNQPRDYLARQQALDPLNSFAVSAPAGSGKTGLITQRILKLLSLSQYPEEILAITFTKKAAGEMQNRVLQALWFAKEQPEPSNPHELNTWNLALDVLKRDQELQWNLLECPQRLRVQTIDSLCSHISRQLPLANGFGSTPSPSDDAEPAYKEAIARVLRLLDSQNSLRVDLMCLLNHLDNNLNQLEQLLITLLAKRDQWLAAIYQASFGDARTYLESVLNEVIESHLKTVHKILSPEASELAQIIDWAANNLVHANSESDLSKLAGISYLPKPIAEELNVWLLISKFLLTGSGTFRKRLTINEGFPAAKDNKASVEYKKRFETLTGLLVDSYPEIENILADIAVLPSSRYTDGQWKLLDSLTRVLPRLAAELQLIFAETGEGDFTAISQSALAALGDENNPTDMALQLDYRIQHILVDEFQDTSSTQLQLLEKLTAGWQGGDGRTLFIVGDGMQSCYAFRSANVGIFLEARDKGIGHLPLISLNLTVNFRSQSGIVEWVNEHFVDAFPAQNDISRGAVVYTPSDAFRPQIDGEAVEVFISPYNTDEDARAADEESPSQYLAEENENQAIAQLILQLRKDHPQDSVALLARSRSHLQSLFVALSRVGLKWQATDIDSLNSRMAIMDLTSLTKALLQPADRIAWLSILRAPWCGLDLQDLHRLVNFDLGNRSPKISESSFPLIWNQLCHFTEIEGLSDHGFCALQRVFPILKVALETTQRKNIRTWIESVWLALGGPATLLDKTDIYDTAKYFELLEQFDRGGYIRDWQSFTRALASLYASPRQDADPKLQVMTMHKSKGLEFDRVIIPRLHKNPPPTDQELILWRERISDSGDRHLLISPLAPVGGENDPIYGYMKNELAIQLDMEATRLFYVGCTRAIKKLYLFACLQTDTKEETPSEIAFKKPANRSLLASIWAKTKGQVKITAISAGDNSYPVAATDSLSKLVRFPTEVVATEFTDSKLLEAYRGRDYDNEDDLPAPENTLARLARHGGSLMHLCLQEYAQLLQRPLFEDWVAKRKPFWLLKLAAWGMNREQQEFILAKCIAALKATINDERGAWILSLTHKSIANELVLNHRQGSGARQTLKTNIIDRTFIDGETRWIIDYKSSEPSGGQTVVDFLAEEIERYKPQLKRYKNCMADMESNRIAVALYFPLLEGSNKFVEVDV